MHRLPFRRSRTKIARFWEMHRLPFRRFVLVENVASDGAHLGLSACARRRFQRTTFPANGSDKFARGAKSVCDCCVQEQSEAGQPGRSFSPAYKSVFDRYVQKRSEVGQPGRDLSPGPRRKEDKEPPEEDKEPPEEEEDEEPPEEETRTRGATSA